LQKKAHPLARRTSPFYNPPQPEKDRDFVWLEPELVAEISFLEWTPAGEVRHPVFHGIRDDKPAAAVTEEPVVDVENGEPVEAETGSTRVQPGRRGNVRLAGQKISNAERVIDSVTGLKKIDLVRYYDEIAEWALPICKIALCHWCVRRTASRVSCFSRNTRNGCGSLVSRSYLLPCIRSTRRCLPSTRTRLLSASPK
jgi:bifunctional non-homologous end joining protein LigD